jgi:hypothetical protein
MASLFNKKQLPRKKLASPLTFHWAEPIIADEISALYSKMLPEIPNEAKEVADEHLRMWHYALQKQTHEAESLHNVVTAKATKIGLTDEDITAIDQAVIELLSILNGTSRLRRPYCPFWPAPKRESI